MQLGCSDIAVVDGGIEPALEHPCLAVYRVVHCHVSVKAIHRTSRLYLGGRRDCNRVPVQAFLDVTVSPANCDFDKHSYFSICRLFLSKRKQVLSAYNDLLMTEA